MDNSQRNAAELEWVIYAYTAYFATAVPRVQVLISSEVILVTDPPVPWVDNNHAAMLRTTPDQADALIERIIRHYRERELTPALVISPSCAPADLAQRVQAHGFVQYGDTEYWLTVERSQYAESAGDFSGIVIRQIGQKEVPDFCRVLAASFEMPEDAVPMLSQHFSCINDLPGVQNYLAYLNGEPVGCSSLFSYLGYGTLGSAGVLPHARRTGAGLAMAVHGYQESKKAGNKLMLIQTVLPKLERRLRIGGCKRAFTRTYYVLE